MGHPQGGVLCWRRGLPCVRAPFPGARAPAARRAADLSGAQGSYGVWRGHSHKRRGARAKAQRWGLRAYVHENTRRDRKQGKARFAVERKRRRRARRAAPRAVQACVGGAVTGAGPRGSRGLGLRGMARVQEGVAHQWRSPQRKGESMPRGGHGARRVAVAVPTWGGG